MNPARQLQLLDAAPSAYADISECGTWRYTLGRPCGRASTASQIAVWVMLNPSTADAAANDPTIRKCVGFAERWGCASIHVVNLFALRATDPKRLGTHADPVGPWNDNELSVACWCARWGGGPLIAAWGAHRHPLLEQRVRLVRELAARHCVQLQCLGRSRDGSPRHPLMLPYATSLESWP
jgi:hypothetical protein